MIDTVRLAPVDNFLFVKQNFQKIAKKSQKSLPMTQTFVILFLYLVFLQNFMAQDIVKREIERKLYARYEFYRWKRSSIGSPGCKDW